MTDGLAHQATTLRQLEALLQTEDFDARLSTISADLPLEQLLVHLGQDAKDRDIFLQLMFVGDLMALEERPDGANGTTDEVDFLQFYSAFPFAPQAATYADLARLILHLNRNLPVSFGLSEADGLAYCRHILVCPQRRLDPRAVVETVDLISYFMDTLGGRLEAVALSEQTLAEALLAVEDSSDD